jgi:hypothetical protein
MLVINTNMECEWLPEDDAGIVAGLAGGTLSGANCCDKGE